MTDARDGFKTESATVSNHDRALQNKVFNKKKSIRIPNSNITSPVVVMVGLLASSTVDIRFESLSGQTKDNTIGICCFSA